MYRYETHMHTTPASLCARATVRESMEFYRDLGYDGIFVTNHFIDGNVGGDRTRPYLEQLDFYFNDVDEALSLQKEIGLRIFEGVELSYGGTDFLIYGLPRAFYYEHPEIMEMEKSTELPFLIGQGALVVQAHPYREAHYIDHIRLYPRCVQGVETINANRTELENRMADVYADAYGLVKTAGSDNHTAYRQKKLAGMQSETPLRDEKDFCARVRRGKMKLFTLDNPFAKD